MRLGPLSLAHLMSAARDTLGEAIDAVHLPSLLNELCPTPQTARLSPERGGTICDPRPGRAERRPSFSVARKDGRWLWHRFGSSEGGSAFELLVSLGLSRSQAAADLKRRAGRLEPATRAYRARAAAPSLLERARDANARWRPLDAATESRARSLLRPLGPDGAAELRARGLWPPGKLELAQVRRDRLRQDGRPFAWAGALAFAVPGPDGRKLAWKIRNPSPLVRPAGTAERYLYLTVGGGAPAWCGPGYGSGRAVLLVEGDLNGAVAHRALELVGARVDVQGLAGASGWPSLAGLAGRPVFVYADNDRAGSLARDRLVMLAREAGASVARRVSPLPAGQDFCSLAGQDGLAALARLLERRLRLDG